MLTASARPDPNAPFARAEITIRGLTAAPSSPTFQLRRSNADYIEPNLDLTGWTRSEVMLLPLDAWWDDADRSFHLLISGLLCQHIDPGPLKLRLPGPGEIDLFWPEDISVYDDGTLAAHARALTDTVRVIGEAPVAPPEPEPPEPEPPPPEPIALPPQPSPWTPPPPAPVAKPRQWRGWAAILLPLLTGAAIIAAVANRHETGFVAPAPQTNTPPRPTGLTATPRRPDAPDEPAVNMRAALDRVIAELTTTGRRTEFDPFLSLRSPAEIIAQAATPEALLRYGAAKLDQREPAAADRLFEEATRPRFGPAQNRPYPPAFLARALLYDPSIQHDLVMPVPNASFAETLYRRAIAAADPDLTTAATRHLQRLTTWQTQRSR